MTAHASTAHSFELHAGALRLALRPDLGGCIAGLWHRETPILRSVEPVELATAWPSGCYPLVPYSNRIGYARFRWKGHDFTTRPNFGESPHSIHGVGWMRPWERVSSSAVEVVLRYRHAADADWPFAFEATQYFNLTPQSLHVEMVVTNLAEVAQPVGLGWHPYFPKRARSRLHIELAERWDGDATGLGRMARVDNAIRDEDDTAHPDFTSVGPTTAAAPVEAHTRHCCSAKRPRYT